ncbi:MAG: transcription antitermination factor NusB [Synergistaceae bacterium]|nr:transcription antitermination factor NusB [Synergistaceae bacterium]
MARKYIGRKFGALHRSRELAVQFLYSLDVYPEQDFAEALERFLSLEDVAQDDKPEVKARCRELAAKVREKQDEIDGVLVRVVTGWRPERMMSVDRTILRLMVLEGFMLKSLPVRSAISEAVNLAGDFGSKDSPRFVNGVMHKAAKYFGEEGESTDAGD